MAWTNLSWRLLLLRAITALVVYAIAAPLALYFLLTLLFRLARSPFSGFWRAVPRSSPPPVLQDAKLGEHNYITLAKVSGLPTTAPQQRFRLRSPATLVSYL